MLDFLTNTANANIVTFIAVLLAAWLAYKFNQISSYFRRRKENLQNMVAMNMELREVYNILVNFYVGNGLPKQKVFDLQNDCDARNVQILFPQIYQPFSSKFINVLKEKGLNDQEIETLLQRLDDEQINSIISKYNIDEKNYKNLYQNIILEQNFLSNVKQSAILIHNEEAIYTTIPSCSTFIMTDINKLSFVLSIDHNPRVYEAIILCLNNLRVLNEVIKTTNDLIIDSIKTKTQAECKSLIVSANKSFVTQLERTMAFANLAEKLTLKWGKRIFGNQFPIKDSGFPDYNNSKYIGILPPDYQYLYLLDPKGRTPMSKMFKFIRMVLF